MAEGHRVPRRVAPQSLDDYFEVLCKAVFQAGMSWKVVEAKWPGIRAALAEFDVRKVALFSEADLERLAHDERVIRNRRKLEAIVQNARKMLDVDAHYDGFRNYLRSHPDFYATARSLQAQFKYLGEMGSYYFLYVVGEEVPPYDEWQAARGRA